MTTTANTAALTSFIVLALSCGDGSASRSGVQSTKTLGEASEDDLQKLCDWALGDHKVDPTPEQLCTRFASQQNASVRECEDLVQSCLADTATGPDLERTCPFSTDRFAGCEVSVAELEDCYAKGAAAARRVYETASCTERDLVQDAAPASCRKLQDQCPNVFDSNDDGDGFVCGDGSRISSDFECDGFEDCVGGEDERCGGGPGGGGSGDDPGGSSGPSGDGGFICNSGDDVNDTFVCDGFADCAGGEDELKCNDDTPPVMDGFKCGDRKVIRQDFVCDGTLDCSDGADEKTCDGGFVCDDGFDISDQWKCDGRKDCKQGEDETGC